MVYLAHLAHCAAVVRRTDMNLFPLSSRVSEWISAAERTSSAKKANKLAVQANEQKEEPMARYTTRRFYSFYPLWVELTYCDSECLEIGMLQASHSLAHILKRLDN